MPAGTSGCTYLSTLFREGILHLWMVGWLSTCWVGGGRGRRGHLEATDQLGSQASKIIHCGTCDNDVPVRSAEYVGDEVGGEQSNFAGWCFWFHVLSYVLLRGRVQQWREVGGGALTIPPQQGFA